MKGSWIDSASPEAVTYELPEAVTYGLPEGVTYGLPVEDSVRVTCGPLIAQLAALPGPAVWPVELLVQGVRGGGAARRRPVGGGGGVRGDVVAVFVVMWWRCCW